MKISKPAAYIFLIFLIAIIVHSTISLFKGNFVQATAMAPFLVVVYVFAIARKNSSEQEEMKTEDADENQDEK